MEITRYVFLDRDGTINKNTGHTHKIEDLEFLPGALEGLAKLQKAGYRLIVITNQAGIAKGMYATEHVEDFHEELKWRAKDQDVSFHAFYHCPHHPDFTGLCLCRKPAPGMLHQAAREHEIDLKQSIMIGDSESDILAGKAVGAKTFLLTSDPNIPTQADYKIKNILDVCEVLL